MNGDGDRDGAGTRTFVEVKEGTQNGNKDGTRSRCRAGMGAGTGV